MGLPRPSGVLASKPAQRRRLGHLAVLVELGFGVDVVVQFVATQILPARVATSAAGPSRELEHRPDDPHALRVVQALPDLDRVVLRALRSLRVAGGDLLLRGLAVVEVHEGHASRAAHPPDLPEGLPGIRHVAHGATGQHDIVEGVARKGQVLAIQRLEVQAVDGDVHLPLKPLQRGVPARVRIRQQQHLGVALGDEALVMRAEVLLRRLGQARQRVRHLLRDFGRLVRVGLSGGYGHTGGHFHAIGPTFRPGSSVCAAGALGKLLDAPCCRSAPVTLSASAWKGLAGELMRGARRKAVLLESSSSGQRAKTARFMAKKRCEIRRYRAVHGPFASLLGRTTAEEDASPTAAGVWRKKCRCADDT
eukprot:scaffold1254_cov251-Pinguiococcus_pyrenoidosus.AAC.7